MKARFFLLLLCCMPFLTYSQSTITINNSATQYGVWYYPSPLDYMYQTGSASSSVIEVGRILSNDIKQGRGFLYFSVGSNTTVRDQLDNITGAKLVFDTGSSSGGSHSIQITKLSSMMHNTDAEIAWSNIGNSTVIATTQSLSANNSNKEVAIDKQNVINAYNSLQGLLFIGLVHSADENSNGIEIKNAKLVITYTASATNVPNAPTGSQLVGSPTHNSCSIKWIAPTTGPTPTGYRVYNGTTLLKNNITTTSTSITGLSAGTAYSLCVKAYNAGGESPCSTPAVSFTTPCNGAISFANQTVSTTQTIVQACDMNIQNVTVTHSATLKITCGGNITLNNITVVSGAKLILEAEGEVVTNGIDVQLGAEFEIK